MSTWFLALEAQQEPFDLEADEHGRAQWSCNFLAWKRPSSTFMAEVLAVLEAAGVGVRGVSIFGGSSVSLPGPEHRTPWLLVKQTGGTAPIGTLNDGATAYRRPGLRVIATAATALEARTLAYAAFDALTAVRNQRVSA